MMSSASITIGFTFQPAAANSHVWVVISSPDPDKGRVLCVNWTTLRASSVDDACVLDPGDHDLIRQPSTVVYSKSKMWDPNKIEFSVQQSALLPRNRVSDEVLKKIHAGGKNSPELSQERKDLIP